MSEPTTEDLLEQMTIALRQLADGHRDVVKILQGVQQWCQLMERRVAALERPPANPWPSPYHGPERNRG